MRYYLFLDNFRGFTDTCIPITDVNFLVGENSTGKTSVLGLLKLISGPQFLLKPNFGDEHVNFGHFSDMVSIHAADKSYFRIGLVFEGSSRKGNDPPYGCLLTFLPDEGLPKLAKCTFCRGNEKVSIRFRGDTAYWKREKYETISTAQEIISRLLPQWVNEHCDTDQGYLRVDFPGGFPGRLPVMVVLSLIWGQQPPDRKGSKDELTFYPPDIAVPPQLTWIAPIRTKPKRTYDELTLDFSPEGAHTPYLIRRLLRRKASTARFRALLQKAGKASRLFQDISIKNYGRAATAPFEVDIVLDDKALNLNTVGYGVSQSLPVLVEILARARNSWFAIQQPEVHLHPRAQAALGDVFFELATTEQKHFLIETHSDFTIDRFRMNYRNDASKKRNNVPDSQILFFERRDRHNVVTPLKIGNSGELPTDQPDSYREFFIREEMRLLGI